MNHYLSNFFTDKYAIIWLHYNLPVHWLKDIFVAMQGLLFIVVHGLLTWQLLLLQNRSSGHMRSVVAAHGLRSWGTQAPVVMAHGLVALWHVESSWTRDRTHVPCVGRQILIHYTSR